ncbi:MAG: (d)CMP kinase [Pseudomonadota bacterium]
MTSKIIAIDGPAASGKGTIGRKIAEKLNYAFLDTGALYRAVAHIVLTADHKPDNEEAAILAAQTLRDTLQDGDLDNPALRSDEVGSAASKVATIEGVREELLALQRDFAKSPPNGMEGAVLDGRDIGTIICPDADAKLFITASTEIRAERRYKELQSKGIDVKRGAVLTDMRERDERDSQRSIAPLIPAEDARIINTSDLSADEALNQALAHIADKLSA